MPAYTKQGNRQPYRVSSQFRSLCIATLLTGWLGACGQSHNPESAAAGANREGNSVVFESADNPTWTALTQVTSGNPETGSFGPLIAWPLVPIHAALTPDGRLMTFGRDPDAASQMFYDIWDWQLSGDSAAHLTLPNTLGTDLFCSNQLLLSNGELLMAGGDIRESGYPGQIGTQLLKGNQDANVYDPANQQLSRRGRLTEPRWYASLTMLPWGDIYVQGGALDMNLNIAARHAEVSNEDASQYRALTGFAVNDLPWYYPRNFSDRYGTIVGWAHNHSYRIDPRGTGQRTDTGQAPGVTLNNGSMAVMYAPGKVLLAGGGSPHAVRADINGEVPAYESVPPMDSPRLWGTATVLPDGKVLVANGGTSDTSIVDAPLGKPALQVMLYDPASNQWQPGASASRPRLYHSTSILLPDATVLLGGGGLPGPVTNLNAELYYPPYLFAADGELAKRPVIKSAASVVSPAASVSVRVNSSAGVSRVVLIKTGAVTHSFDMDQRFVELSLRPTTEQGETTIVAALPEAPADTPPGFYHLFVIDQEGVPSVSRIIRMTPYQGELPPPPKPAMTLNALGTPNDNRTQVLSCAPGEQLAGVHGKYSEWVRSLGAICLTSETDGHKVISRAPNISHQASGLLQTFSLQCLAGEFATGFQAQLSGDRTRFLGLQVTCRSESGAGSTTRTVGEWNPQTIESSENCQQHQKSAGMAVTFDEAGITTLAMRCRD